MIINLKSVVVCCRILEQSVVRIEHFLGEEVEPLPRHPAVVQTNLAWGKYSVSVSLPTLALWLKLPSNSIQSLVNLAGWNGIDLSVGVLQDFVSSNLKHRNII